MKLIETRGRDIGGFEVRRALPHASHRMVGPFVFWDHMGPAQFPPGQGMDVRPHPHIGLSTLTYLFEGRVMHRDSLGYEQAIEPGAINWMTAGSGIVHSERTHDDDRTSGLRMNGIQSWIALPTADEETEPHFKHHPADTIPRFEIDGATITVVAGTAMGHTSPVKTYSPMYYVDINTTATCSLRLPREYSEHALYVAEGEATFCDTKIARYQLGIHERDDGDALTVGAASRVLIFGGEPVGPRTIWWNFVSSRPERIKQAKQDWKAGQFPSVPGETEFIPLPEDP